MPNRFDPKIRTVMHALHAKGFIIKGIRNGGIRVRFGNKIAVDFYTLKCDPAQVRARVKLDITDESARAEMITDIDVFIRRGLAGIADIDNFRLSRYSNGFFQYYARIAVSDLKPQGEEADSDSVEIMTTPKEKEREPLGIDLKAAVDLLETVDSRKFRQALDDLGLPRSSILRVSLTRIFRAAADMEELEIAFREEAERIADPRDRKDLEHIRTANKVQFLAPLIAMLHKAAGCDESCPEIRITL